MENLFSKRGTKKTSHCSSLNRVIKKVDDLSSLFNSLEKCTNSLNKLFVASIIFGYTIFKIVVYVTNFLQFLLSSQAL